MKYKNEIITFCVIILAITAVLLTVFILDMTGKIYLPTGSLLITGITLIGMLLISVIAIVILMSIYNDWKWRNLKKNEKWKR